MQPISTSSRRRAIVAAIAFTTGALAVMLQDIIDLRHPTAMWEAWSMKHTLAVLMLLGVTLIAEEVFSAFRAQKYIVAAGIALVTAAGILLILYNSVGRQVEAVSTQQLSAKDHNDQIAAAKKRLADAMEAKKKVDADAIKESAAKSCKSICKSVIETTQKAADEEVKEARATLRGLGAPKAVAAKVEQWAETMAIFKVPKELTREIASKFEYPLLTLLFEIGAMVSWCYARREETVVAEAKAANKPEWKPSPADSAQTDFPAPETDPTPPTPPPRGNRRRNSETVAERCAAAPDMFSATVVDFPGRREAKVSKLAAWAWLSHYLEQNGFLHSQDVMANQLGVYKGTVSKWLDDLEAERKIVRETVGRRKVVRLADVAIAS